MTPSANAFEVTRRCPCLQEGVRLSRGAELQRERGGAAGDRAGRLRQLPQDGARRLLRGRAREGHREGARDTGRLLRREGTEENSSMFETSAFLPRMRKQQQDL